MIDYIKYLNKVFFFYQLINVVIQDKIYMNNIDQEKQMKIGIVGLPNVGKSTLFNSITKAGAESANYPFCTIEPNVGVVSVPDERLEVLSKIFNSKRIVPTYIEFVDIAGLVKGASKGEGLRKQVFITYKGSRQYNRSCKMF